MENEEYNEARRLRELLSALADRCEDVSLLDLLCKLLLQEAEG